MGILILPPWEQSLRTQVSSDCGPRKNIKFRFTGLQPALHFPPAPPIYAVMAITVLDNAAHTLQRYSVLSADRAKERRAPVTPHVHVPFTDQGTISTKRYEYGKKKTNQEKKKKGTRLVGCRDCGEAGLKARTLLLLQVWLTRFFRSDGQ